MRVCVYTPIHMFECAFVETPIILIDFMYSRAMKVVCVLTIQTIMLVIFDRLLKSRL